MVNLLLKIRWILKDFENVKFADDYRVMIDYSITLKYFEFLMLGCFGFLFFSPFKEFYFFYRKVSLY